MIYSDMSDIRYRFAELLGAKKFTTVSREATMTNLVGNTTIEIMATSFIAEESAIFGTPNKSYIEREEEWYNSMSLNVNDIPGGAPSIWKSVADKDGFINSNYGWVIYSPENGFSNYEDATKVQLGDSQYSRVVEELRRNPESRRAEMIYTRPSMWLDYNKNGRSDFMCTETVQYLVRDGAVHAVVKMRSCDSIFGYRNDWAWQKHVLDKVSSDINVPAGTIYWQVGSLHVYSRHYYLVDHYARTGEINITAQRYSQIYPNSMYKEIK